MTKDMTKSFYKTLVSNKSDVVFIERLTNKKIDEIKKLLESEEDLDLLFQSCACNCIISQRTRISKKIMAKYLVMRYAHESNLNIKDKSYLSKFVGFYLNRLKIEGLLSIDDIMLTPVDDKTARIHLAVFFMKQKDYLEARNISKQEAIKEISRAFQNSKETRSLGENLVSIIKILTIIKRSIYFNNFYKQK